MSEPGGPIRLSTRIAAVVPSSSSRRGGAGALYCRALRRRRGEEPVQNHRIDGVVQPPVYLPRRSPRTQRLRLQPFPGQELLVSQRCRTTNLG